MSDKLKKEARLYHSSGRPGKIEVVPTKLHSTQNDLALAYTPGVAVPCLDIEKNPDDIYKYTAKGNLVAVISNGTAVLGLGDIGADAGKPVMEGKGLLFKIFGDVDVFDIEVDTKDIDKFVETVKNISVTFGGINLEDIKAPECFEIEERLKEELNIPVMHDDQHGTAIISASGLLNALELAGKKIEEVRMVVSGAGAAAMACTRLYMSFGLKKENVIMCDSKGPIHKGRTDLNKYKQAFANDKEFSSLAEAIKGADVFVGLSKAGVLTQDMVRSMSDNPIVFAMANPDPEITYEDAIAAREDVIMATGRSDYPNQINNVLGFPFIFRGALDVKATAINEEMKKAAAIALANLAKKDVPEVVNIAYNKNNIIYGREYIIPKPLDPRLITHVAPAVAKAAMDSGVAKEPIKDWDAYIEELSNRMGLENHLMRAIQNKAKNNPKSIVFAEANHFNVLKAAHIVKSEGYATPILLGDKEEILELIENFELDLKDVQIINPKARANKDMLKKYAQHLFEKRQRKGLTFAEALEKMSNRNYFASMMVELGDADAFISGYSTKYASVLKPAIETIGIREEAGHVAGMYLLMTKQGPVFFADTTVNFEPDKDNLVHTALLTAEAVRKFNVEPIIAFLSYSNFGSSRRGTPSYVREAVSILHQDYPELMVEGEMQANFAFNTKKRMEQFPFNKLGDKRVNTVIFPNLSSGNIAYKMMQELGEVEAIGPVLMGLNKAAQIVQLGSSVQEIVNLAVVAVVDSQFINEK